MHIEVFFKPLLFFGVPWSMLRQVILTIAARNPPTCTWLERRKGVRVSSFRTTG